MANSIITSGKVLHQIVIGQLQGVSEDQFDIQAKGFNNTIRCNGGHMVYWMDKYSTLSFGMDYYSALEGGADRTINGAAFPSLRTDARNAGPEAAIAIHRGPVPIHYLGRVVQFDKALSYVHHDAKFTSTEPIME